jgi:hypothetical protein
MSIEKENYNNYNDLRIASKWTRDYTYPKDSNILKFGLQGKIIIIMIHFKS